MKDYYEKIYEIVENRGEERIRQRKAVMVRRTRAVYSTAGLCAAMIVGFGIWHNNNIKQLASRESNEPEIVTATSESTAVSTKTTTSPAVTTHAASSTNKKKTTTVSSTQTASSVKTAVETSGSAQTTAIESADNHEQSAETVTSAGISEIRINAPDTETVKSQFSEIQLDNGITYKLLYTDIDRSTIGTAQKEVILTSTDRSENKRYVSNAEIYDVSVESSEDLIAVKYGGGEEVHLYSPNETEGLDWINFAMPYGDYYYRSCGKKRISDDRIGEFLGDIELKALNLFKLDEEVSVSGKIYKIKNISSDCALAVKYETDGEYHLFSNVNYIPETLGQMISDLDLKNEMEIVAAYIDGQAYAIDSEKVWEYLLSEENAQSFENGIHPSDYSVSVNVPILGKVRIVINIYADGHISTNIPTGRAPSFDIGKGNVDKFIEYVRQYGVPIELPPHPSNANADPNGTENSYAE